MQLLRRFDDGREIWQHALKSDGSDWRDPPFAGEPFVVVVVNNIAAAPCAVRAGVAERLVAAACRYAVCFGHECSLWDDAIDEANIEADPALSDELFVMTTWHEGELPSEVVHFALNCTDSSKRTFRKYLVLFIGHDVTIDDAFTDAFLGA